MLNIKLEKKGNLLKSIEGLQKMPIKDIAEDARKEIIAENEFRNWKRLKQVTEVDVLSEDVAEIFIGGDAETNLIYNVLQGGRKAFFIKPVRASALHFNMGGISIFSKGHTIPAMKGYNWLSLTDRVKNAVEKSVNNYLNKFK